MMKLYRQRLFSDLNSSISSVVLQYLGRLSGFISRAKSLHWGARGKDIHEYLDGLWKELYEFQDTVAEGFMGIGGQFAAQDVPYIPADEKINPQAFIREVEDKTLEFYNLLPADDPRYKGLCGETESFIQTIEKYKYLFGLCNENEGERNFSEKSKINMDKKDLAAIGLGTAGIIGGSVLKNKGENLGQDKLVKEIHRGGLKARRSRLKHQQKALRDEMKAATDKEAYKKIADKFDKLGERIGKNAKELAENEEAIKKLGKKSRKYTKAGKAILVTSMAAPIVYSTIRAGKKQKENK